MKRKLRNKFKVKSIQSILRFYEMLEQLELCSPTSRTRATDRIVDIAATNMG